MKSIYFLCLNMIRFVPYAYGFLQNYARLDEKISKNYTWEEPFCILEPVKMIVEKIHDPDFLFLSCYVWNHNQQMEIAKRVKKKYPECKVICGGPHIPDLSDSYFSQYPFADVLVHGEGEIPVRNLLLEYIEKTPDLNKVKGISFNVGSKAVKTGVSGKLSKDLPVPSPYLNGLFDSFFNKDSTNKIGLWETNRGCPFSCCFCDWGVRTTNKIRLHSMQRISQEIEWFGQNKIEDIYITDANFGLLERDLEIAELLVACKKKYDFPKRIRIQFAKKFNTIVFEISRLLFENQMLWGTTLSMQSVDLNVLKAIKRPHVGIDNYKKAKEKYKAYNIPTYTELILGLPLETKKSFMEGICTLFDIGMHDDFRMFELVLLPNAPLFQDDMRKEYGLHTKMKPVRKNDPGCEKEYVELVFGTSTMPVEDWEYCFVFSETAQALHNGGYTRFVARYLKENNILSYYDFYNNFLKYMLHSDSESSKAFNRVKKLINAFYNDPDMPQINRVLTQPDMAGFLGTFNPKRKGWQLWTYIWLWISMNTDGFYMELFNFIKDQGVIMNETIEDLMQYQKEIMLALDYDPLSGKEVHYKFNWFDYFYNDQILKKEPTILKYNDKRMGASYQYGLEKNDKKKFITAAIGFSYPYSKFRHFFHQFEKTEIIKVN